MDATLAGLLGVVIGGVLAGVVNQRLDVVRRRKSAHAVGVLVVSELRSALRAISGAVDNHDQAQPKVNIATSVWRERGEALAVDVDPDVWLELDKAYATIDHVNRHAATMKRQELEKSGATLVEGQQALAADLERITRNRGPRRALRGWTAVLAVGIPVVLLLFGVLSLVVPQDDLSSSSVAASLEHELEFRPDAAPVDYIVDCDPQADDWVCTIDRAFQNTAVCPVSSLDRANGTSCPGGRVGEVQVVRTDGDTFPVISDDDYFAKKFGVESTTRPRTSIFRRVSCNFLGLLCNRIIQSGASR
jgi:hypothetical protein